MDRYINELDRSGYDNWRTREYSLKMARRNNLGCCYYCGDDIYEDMDFVEDIDGIQHLECYEQKKIDEEYGVDIDE